VCVCVCTLDVESAREARPTLEGDPVAQEVQKFLQLRTRRCLHAYDEGLVRWPTSWRVGAVCVQLENISFSPWFFL
jgi:hypothetical protein